jgi:NAD(P)-dependent dehydrogenase (short-subunit alcohol dehydrogenase family)
MNKDQVVLVTGSSRGIGAVMAKRLAESGRRVVINCSRSEPEALEVLDEITRQAAGAERAMMVRADVCQRAEVEGMFDEVIDRFGGVDVLINNAGLNLDGPFLEMNDEEWDRVISTNLTGPFVCSQTFAHRHTGHGGHIVNLAAATGITGRGNGANYCSAKAGLITLTKCLAIELAPSIQVNTVTPGFINTEEVMTRFNLNDPDTHAALVGEIPMGRLGTPEDIYRAVDYLIGQASFVTGQNIFVNGGDFRH